MMKTHPFTEEPSTGTTRTVTPGTLVDPPCAYDTAQYLGSGNMGSVYLAVCAHRTCVVKKGGVAFTEANTQQIMQESRFFHRVYGGYCRSYINLIHTNTLEYRLILPYIQGENLFTAATHIKSLPQNKHYIQFLALLHIVVTEVENVHGYGIIHGDLTWGNILVSGRAPALTAKLIDFGWSYERSGNATTTPQPTPHWHRDRQAVSDGAPALPADPKQDIYSVIYLFQIMADYYQIRAPLIQNIQLDRRCLIIPTGYQLLVQIYDELYRLSAPLSSPTLAPSATVSAPPTHYPTPVAAR